MATFAQRVGWRKTRSGRIVKRALTHTNLGPAPITGACPRPLSRSSSKC